MGTELRSRGFELQCIQNIKDLLVIGEGSLEYQTCNTHLGPCNKLAIHLDVKTLPLPSYPKRGEVVKKTREANMI